MKPVTMILAGAALAASLATAHAQSIFQRPDGLWACSNDPSRIVVNGDWRVVCFQNVPSIPKREFDALREQSGTAEKAHLITQASVDHRTAVSAQANAALGRVPSTEIPELAEIARSMNMTVRELVYWQTAARFAGVNAEDNEAIGMAARLSHTAGK